MFNCFAAFVKLGNKCEKFTLKAFTRTIIEKGLAVRKKETILAASNALCELWEHCNKQAFYDAINSCITENKRKFKIIMYGIQATLVLLDNFGPEELQYLKPFSAKIEEVTKTATQTQLKKQCMAFYQEVFKWVGPEVSEVYTKNLKEA